MKKNFILMTALTLTSLTANSTQLTFKNLPTAIVTDSKMECIVAQGDNCPNGEVSTELAKKIARQNCAEKLSQYEDLIRSKGGTVIETQYCENTSSAGRQHTFKGSFVFFR